MTSLARLHRLVDPRGLPLSSLCQFWGQRIPGSFTSGEEGEGKDAFRTRIDIDRGRLQMISKELGRGEKFRR